MSAFVLGSAHTPVQDVECGRRFPSPLRKDEQQTTRICAPRRSFQEIACTTLEPLEESAERSPVVARHLRSALAAAAADLDGSLAAALDPASR